MEDCGLASFVKLALQNSLGVTILLQYTLTGQPMSPTAWGVKDHVLLLTIRIQIRAYLLFTTSTVSQLAVRCFWKFIQVKSTAVTNFYLN